MAKCLLDEARFSVWTAGFWLTIRSFAAGNLELSNWLIIDKLNERDFRLSEPDHEFLGTLSDHFHTSQFRRKWRSLRKSARRSISQRVLADGVEAIISARDGNMEKFAALKSMDDSEFDEYATKYLDPEP